MSPILEVAWACACPGQPAPHRPLADARWLQLHQRPVGRHHAADGLRKHALLLLAQAQLPRQPLLAACVAPPPRPRAPGLQEAPPGCTQDPRRYLEILPQQCEQDGVLPGAVTEVRLALHALADEADALGMADRCLVEAVTRELQPVVPELEQQVPLEQTGGLVGDSLTAEVGVDGEHLELCDPMHVADLVVAHRPRALSVELDDHAPEAGRLALGALDLGPNRCEIRGTSTPEERLDVLVAVERSQPNRVSGLSAPDRDHRHCTVTVERRESSSRPGTMLVWLPLPTSRSTGLSVSRTRSTTAFGRCSSDRRTTSSSRSSRCSGRSTAATSTRRACSSGCRARASVCCKD